MTALPPLLEPPVARASEPHIDGLHRRLSTDTASSVDSTTSETSTISSSLSSRRSKRKSSRRRASRPPELGSIRKRSNSDSAAEHRNSDLSPHLEFQTQAKSDIYRVLFSDSAALLIEACQISHFQQAQLVSTSLIALLRLTGSTESFLKRLITERLSRLRPTESHDFTNSLRDNNMTVLLLAAYCKTEGADFLKSFLSPIFPDILSAASKLEINPAELPEGQSVEENLHRLLGVIKMIVDRMEEVKHKFPIQLKKICQKMKRQSDAKLVKIYGGDIDPGPASLRLVGCLIFLRFIGPVVAAPVGTALDDGKAGFTKEERRGLILTAKVLNMMAAESGSVPKEEYMEPLIPLLQESQRKMREFLLFVCKAREIHNEEDSPLTPTSLANPPSYPMPYEIAMDNIISFLLSAKSKLQSQVEGSPKAELLRPKLEQLNRLMATVEPQLQQNSQPPPPGGPRSKSLAEPATGPLPDTGRRSSDPGKQERSPNPIVTSFNTLFRWFFRRNS